MERFWFCGDVGCAAVGKVVSRQPQDKYVERDGDEQRGGILRVVRKTRIWGFYCLKHINSYQSMKTFRQPDRSVVSAGIGYLLQ
jgi:hypothetical protein